MASFSAHRVPTGSLPALGASPPEHPGTSPRGRDDSSQRAIAAHLPSSNRGTFSGIAHFRFRINILFSGSYKNIMAEREGFEPSLELPLNTLSKRAP